MPNEMTAAEAAKTLEEAARQAHQVLESPTIFYDTKSMPGGIKTMQKCEAAYTLAASLCRKVASGELREVRHARWALARESELCYLVKCTNCGHSVAIAANVPIDEWRAAHSYCVDCGALMDGGEKHE
jgi:hypothetical protein